MRLRSLRPKDRPHVRSVYEARSRVSAGLMERNPAYWRGRWRDRSSKGPFVIAEDHGRILGYATASLGGGLTAVREVIWRPESDGTDVGPRLVAELLRRLERIRPISIAAFEMAGSPALPHLRAALGRDRPPNSVFMAGVIDTNSLLRDAVRVLRRRRVRRLRLRVAGHTAVIGGGPVEATVSMDGHVLLGLLFGTRNFDSELQKHRVHVAPRSAGALRRAKAAFPPRRIAIADAW